MLSQSLSQPPPSSTSFITAATAQQQQQQQPPLSLARVQQADPLCRELLDQAGPCALYQRAQDRCWLKCRHGSSGQGRLALYRRAAAPLHAFAVLGCGPDRVQPLAGALELQPRPPFLLFGGGGGGSHGVWFRDEADCERLAGRMARLMAAAGDSVGDVGLADVNGDGDGHRRRFGIVDMLGRAQAEYEEEQATRLLLLPRSLPGGDTCELVARRIRQQLGLAQPEEKAAAAAVAAAAHASHRRQQSPSPSPSPPPSPSPFLIEEAAEAEELEEFLLTPGMLESPPSPTSPLGGPRPDGEDNGVADASPSPSPPSPSTREQLQSSLEQLLEQDATFIGLLHRAYVASLQRRLGGGGGGQ